MGSVPTILNAYVFPPYENDDCQNGIVLVFGATASPFEGRPERTADAPELPAPPQPAAIAAAAATDVRITNFDKPGMPMGVPFWERRKR
jgi:hypothetical protein